MNLNMDLWHQLLCHEYKIFADRYELELTKFSCKNDGFEFKQTYLLIASGVSIVSRRIIEVLFLQYNVLSVYTISLSFRFSNVV